MSYHSHLVQSSWQTNKNSARAFPSPAPDDNDDNMDGGHHHHTLFNLYLSLDYNFCKQVSTDSRHCPCTCGNYPRTVTNSRTVHGHPWRIFFSFSTASRVVSQHFTFLHFSFWSYQKVNNRGGHFSQMPEVPEDCGRSAGRHVQRVGRRTGRHSRRAGSDAAGMDSRKKCWMHG